MHVTRGVNQCGRSSYQGLSLLVGHTVRWEPVAAADVADVSNGLSMGAVVLWEQLPNSQLRSSALIWSL